MKITQMALCFTAYLLLAGSSLIPEATIPPDTLRIRISGKIEMTGGYCGGAPPPKELLERARQKRPLADYKLYIIEGSENTRHATIIDSTVTDSNGIFEFYLPAGEYVLLSPHQKDRAIFRNNLHNDYIAIKDLDCLEEWWQKGLMKLIVRDQPIDNIYFHFQKPCFLPAGVPCLVYTGPLPQ